MHICIHIYSPSIEMPAAETHHTASAVAMMGTSTPGAASATAVAPFFSKTFRYKWTSESAGGAHDPENASFRTNPMFRLDSDVAQRVFVKARCDSHADALGMHVFASGERAHEKGEYLACCSVLQCVAVCCTVLHCVALCCTVLLPVINVVCCNVLQCAAVCCSVLQCVVVCCSVLQCDAV